MNYQVKTKYGRDPFSGMPSSIPDGWNVVDLEGTVVCFCNRKHNAELLCKLLNAHT